MDRPQASRGGRPPLPGPQGFRLSTECRVRNKSSGTGTVTGGGLPAPQGRQSRGETQGSQRHPGSSAASRGALWAGGQLRERETSSAAASRLTAKAKRDFQRSFWAGSGVGCAPPDLRSHSPPPRAFPPASDHPPTPLRGLSLRTPFLPARVRPPGQLSAQPSLLSPRMDSVILCMSFIRCLCHWTVTSGRPGSGYLTRPHSSSSH